MTVQHNNENLTIGDVNIRIMDILFITGGGRKYRTTVLSFTVNNMG